MIFTIKTNNQNIKPTSNDAEKKYYLFFFLSILLHSFVAYYLVSIDIKKIKSKSIEELPERVVKIIMDKPKELKEKPKISSTEKTTGENVEETIKETENQKAVSKKKKAAQKSVAKKARRVQEELRSSGVLALLTSKGSTTRSKMSRAVDVLGGQKANFRDIDDALKNVTGIKRAGSASEMDIKLSSKRVINTNEKISINDMVGGFEKTKKTFSKLGDIKINKPKMLGRAANSANRDDKAIADVVRRNMRSIKAVYNRFLKRDPGLQGKVTVRFTILPNGRVSKVEVAESTITNKSFINSILRRIKNWRFAKISQDEGSVTVNFPFVFQSKG